MKNTICLLLLIAVQCSSFAQPLDDIVKRTTISQKSPLAYAPIREADILWEKRIWRIIDVREKMNRPFMYPEKPFFEILTDAVAAQELTVYSAETDDFSYELSEAELHEILFRTDTIEIFDPETYDPKITVVSQTINYEDVKRFRLKELWYFDAQMSTLKVRILGFAPVMDVYDDNGNFKFQKPLFWVYYRDARETLSKHEVFNALNDNGRMTWEDWLEMRYFSSTVSKESNMTNDRLEDKFSGLDLLHEADKVNQKIFNYEHDLWSY